MVAPLKNFSATWFAVILMGHMTTAPWNMFINNQGWFIARLNLEPPKAALTVEKEGNVSTTANVVTAKTPLVTEAEPETRNSIPLGDATAELKSNQSVTDTDTEKAEKENEAEAKKWKKIACLYEFCLKDPQDKDNYCGEDWPATLNNQTFENFKNSAKTIASVKANEAYIRDLSQENNAFNDYEKCLAALGDKPNSKLANFWASNLSLVSMLISFVSSIFCTILVQKMDERLRTYGVWGAVFLIFLINLILAWTVYIPSVFFGITLGLAAVIIFSGMLFQSTCFAILSGFHFTYIVTLMEGQGLGGIWIAVTKIACGAIEKALVKGGMDSTAASNLAVSIYWILALMIIVVTYFMWKLVFVKNTNYKEGASSEKSGIEEVSSMMREKEPLTMEATVPFCEIMRGICFQAISVFLTFFICLLLFPGVLGNVCTHDGEKNVLGFVSIDWSFLNTALFLMFNIGDWLGKKLAKYEIVRSDQEYLLLSITLLRGLFYPIFLYGLNLTGQRTGLLANKYSFIILNFIFATSSGYMGSLPMRFAPEVLESKLKAKYNDAQINEAKGKASTYMVCFLIGGLMTGSLCSFIPVGIVVETRKSLVQAAFVRYFFPI